MSLDYRNIEITEEIFNSPEYTEYRKERIKIFCNYGVYIINNKLNGHNYIGSSINIKQRFAQHKSTLRHNTHRNQHLQNAWNKYGEENFDF
jgi:predicted GIY-YIG superfamily endonuclease